MRKIIKEKEELRKQESVIKELEEDIKKKSAERQHQELQGRNTQNQELEIEETQSQAPTAVQCDGRDYEEEPESLIHTLPKEPPKKTRKK